MRRAEKLLKRLRKELKDPPALSSNETAIEQALESCIAEVRRLNASDRVFLDRETLEGFVEYFENTPGVLMDDDKRELLKSLKEALAEK